jgi:hypothetical protein
VARSTRLATAVLLAGLTGAALSGCFGGPPSAPSTSSASSGAEVQLTDSSELAVGDCFDDPAASAVTDVELVDCDDAHDFEVYDEFELTADEFEGDGAAIAAGAFPGAAVVATAAEAGCLEERFETFVGVGYDDSRYGATYLAPTEGSWAEDGDRHVSCLVGDPEGPTSGSLAGAAE